VDTLGVLDFDGVKGGGGCGHGYKAAYTITDMAVIYWAVSALASIFESERIGRAEDGKNGLLATLAEQVSQAHRMLSSLPHFLLTGYE
ncbi:MAG TPA: hypothetical protein VFM32_01725, partial [Spongiibacteraceae bacterium]|nr:hypothetical protein [Spongiibacteraceae bacterium]